MRREAQANVLELSKELNEVNMNLQSVFMQLRCATGSTCVVILSNLIQVVTVS